MQTIIKPLIWLMELCYNICKNYGWAIILFTLFSKIILLPVSVWVQKNSIKMVQMTPDLNFAKANSTGTRNRLRKSIPRFTKSISTARL